MSGEVKPSIPPHSARLFSGVGAAAVGCLSQHGSNVDPTPTSIGLRGLLGRFIHLLALRGGHAFAACNLRVVPFCKLVGGSIVVPAAQGLPEGRVHVDECL